MSATLRSRALVAAAASALAGAFAFAPGCSSRTTPASGLLLTLSTDGTLSQADSLHVDISSADGSKTYQSEQIALPAQATLPTTLGVDTSPDGATSLTIDASLWAGGTELDDRHDQVVQIPTDEVVSLSIVFSASCTASSCVAGQTCNPADGSCMDDTVNASTLPVYGSDGGGTSRDATVVACSAATCSAGCCGSDGQCHTDETASACGTGGGSCATCTTAQTCNAGACAAKCTADSCPTGCCDATGTCQTTTTDSLCGSGGAACGACTAPNQCVNGACGCSTSADCPSVQACDPVAHTCSGKCSATIACNGGCCESTTSTCVDGSEPSTCGATGGACTSCSTATGTACVAGTCGCNGAEDCPVGNACDPTTHQCSASCTGSTGCQGSCCDGKMCQPIGTMDCVGNAPRTCNAQGAWTNAAACANQACVSGACTGECAPGTWECCLQLQACPVPMAPQCGTVENVTPCQPIQYGGEAFPLSEMCNATGVWVPQAQCGSCVVQNGGMSAVCN